MSLTNRIAARGRVLNATTGTPPATPAPAADLDTLPTRRRRRWQCGPVLNQGREPSCTGFAWAARLLAEPGGDTTATAKQGNALGSAIWKSFAGRGGMSASEAGGRYAVENGLADSFASIPDLATMAETVLNDGPVVVSVDWGNPMSNPDRRGLIHVETTDLPGSHCLLVTGYEPAHVTRPARKHGRRKRPARKEPCFKLRNSWGTWWGKGGDAWITARDLDRLLAVWDYGELAVAPSPLRNVDVDTLLAT